MTIFERIRYFRKEIAKINQEDFAKRINMSRSNLGNIETARIALTDRVISDICEEFNLSEEWLRTGQGDMYEESEAAYVASLCEQYNMSPEQKKIMEIFLSMSEEKRDAVSKAFFDFLDSAKKVDAVEVSNSVGEVGNSVGEVADSDVDDADQAAIDAEAEAYRQELIAEKKAASHSDDGSEHTGA